MRPALKSGLYRHEVTQAAVGCVFEAIGRIERREEAALPANRGRGASDPPAGGPTVSSTRPDIRPRKRYTSSGRRTEIPAVR